MKKIRFETVELMLEMGMPLQEGLELAFNSIDRVYADIPLEKPTIVILNDKEYERPK
jgi:hypothetical protein